MPRGHVLSFLLQVSACLGALRCSGLCCYICQWQPLPKMVEDQFPIMARWLLFLFLAVLMQGERHVHHTPRSAGMAHVACAKGFPWISIGSWDLSGSVHVGYNHKIAGWMVQ